MFSRSPALLAFALGLLVLMPRLRAETGDLPALAELPETPAVAEISTASNPEIEGWLAALRSHDFEERRDAARKLVAANAVEPVARLATDEDLEVSSRCLDILKRIYTNGDAKAKAAAETALKMISESEHRSIASRAADIIRKPDPELQRVQVFGGVNRNVRVIRAGNGNIQAQIVMNPAIPQAGPQPAFPRRATIREPKRLVNLTETESSIRVQIIDDIGGKPKVSVIEANNLFDLRKKNAEAAELVVKHLRKNEPAPPAIPAVNPIAGGVIMNGGIIQLGVANGQLNVKTRIVNGQRDIEIDENGRKVQITDKMGRDIKVRTTETVNGKEKTTEASAKDLEELRKQHPEAAKDYERFAGNGGVQGAGGAIQIQQEIRIEAAPGRALPIRRALPIQAVPVPLPALPALPEVPAIPEAGNGA